MIDTKETSQIEAMQEQLRALDARAAKIYGNFIKESIDLNDLVDPRDAYFDDQEMSFWIPAGGSGLSPLAGGPPFRNEQEHRNIRAIARQLSWTNEFAIGGHESRISYIVGEGHQYNVMAKMGMDIQPDVLIETQKIIDEFREKNRWCQRQQENQRRLDRDGEVFLRKFVDADGMVRVRYVEPSQVSQPTGRAGLNNQSSFGVQLNRDDAETVEFYWVDGEAIEASQIQHRKANVDMTVKRGMPLFFPVRKNLKRAEQLLRNMSAVASIQAAIALIRRHGRGSKAPVTSFRADQADVTVTNETTGKTRYATQYQPGTILDAPQSVEYDFPTKGIDASKYVVMLQAILRSVAARVVMPEFMLTSDASNANFASTMVAEGPAVKMFKRMQASMIEDDLEILRFVLQVAEGRGRLPAGTSDAVTIDAHPPSVAVRDDLKEAQALQIDLNSGLLSPQTWSLRRGYDYDQEQKNKEEHDERAGMLGGVLDTDSDEFDQLQGQ